MSSPVRDLRPESRRCVYERSCNHASCISLHVGCCVAASWECESSRQRVNSCHWSLNCEIGENFRHDVSQSEAFDFVYSQWQFLTSLVCSSRNASGMYCTVFEECVDFRRCIIQLLICKPYIGTIVGFIGATHWQ